MHYMQKGKQDGKNCFAAGAVYILFMNTDGTVKYHRKISARSGNLIIGPQYVLRSTPPMRKSHI